MPQTAPQRVAVTGASGLVGSHLVPFLAARGFVVQEVKRHGATFEEDVLSRSDIVINLAGAGLADARWTSARKRELIDSRVGYTRRLVASVRARNACPKLWVQASAVGVYGNRGSEWLTENSTIDAARADFLSRLCLDWEAAGQEAASWGARVVQLRIGVVQTPEGGALKKMLPLFRFGLGGPLAGGANWQSWIALDELLHVFAFVIGQEKLSGPVNAVAPLPVTSAQYARALGHHLHRPAILPVPGLALRAVLGEMADAALLSSQRVKPERLLESGYTFRYPTLEDALRHLL